MRALVVVLAVCLLELPASAACPSGDDPLEVFLQAFPEEGSLKVTTLGCEDSSFTSRDLWCDCDDTCGTAAACATACGAADFSDAGGPGDDPMWMLEDTQPASFCGSAWSSTDTEYHPRICITRGAHEDCGGTSFLSGSTSTSALDPATVDETGLIIGQSNAGGASTFMEPHVLPTHLLRRVVGAANYTGSLRLMRLRDPWFVFFPTNHNRFEDGGFFVPFGPQYSTPWPWFAHDWLRTNTTQTLGLYHASQGGVCLVRHNVFGTGRWNPGDPNVTDDGESVYENFIDYMIDLLAAGGQTPDWIVWDQGECDSLADTPVTANEYEQEVKDLYDGLVNDLEAAGYTGVAGTPMYLARINDVNAADDAINTGIAQAIADRAEFNAGVDRASTAAVTWTYDTSHVQNVDDLGRCWRDVLDGGATDCSGIP